MIAQFQAKTSDHYLANASKQESIDYALKKMHEIANPQRDSVINNNIPPETEKWSILRQKFSYYIWLESLPEMNILKLHFFDKEKNVLNFSNPRKIFVNSAPPSSITSNRLQDSTPLHINFVDSLLIPAFKQKQNQLSPADTLILLLKRNAENNKISTILTHTGQIDSVLNDSIH